MATPEQRVDGVPPGRAPHQVRPTRTSTVWTAVVAGFVIAVLLLIFLLENTGSVQISFLGASGRVPLAAALLAAALAGALVVLVVAVARTAQLRVTARRHRRQDRVPMAAPEQDEPERLEPEAHRPPPG
jgi:lipopolysaccharide assembly protein A